MPRSSRNPKQNTYTLAYKASRCCGDGVKIVWYGQIEKRHVMSVEKAAEVLQERPAVYFPRSGGTLERFQALIQEK